MPSLLFERRLIADEPYEATAVFDVDNDGVLDIVSGAYWYPGPNFEQKCYRGPVLEQSGYRDDFFSLPIDVDGDGYLDVVTGGWFGETLRWQRNPNGSRDERWEIQEIARIGPIETARAWDIDGDGRPEIVPNTPGGPQRIFKLDVDQEGRGTASFREFTIYSGQTGHGIGCGDIAGNGRADLVLADGWLEAPADPYAGEWRFHPEFTLGGASIPIVVADFNGDGLSELIVGHAHGYGLDWYEQKLSAGKRTWVRHPIDPYCSQYHDLAWVDIDGDGEPELLSGKRYRAHDHDPGAHDPLGIYYFKWTGESFAKQVVDFGPVGSGSGCGISFAVADLDGSGLPDIVAPGKDGLHLFRNRGFRSNPGDRPMTLRLRGKSELESWLAQGAELVGPATMPYGDSGPVVSYIRLANEDRTIFEIEYPLKSPNGDAT